MTNPKNETLKQIKIAADDLRSQIEQLEKDNEKIERSYALTFDSPAVSREDKIRVTDAITKYRSIYEPRISKMKVFLEVAEKILNKNSELTLSELFDMQRFISEAKQYGNKN